ncbi:uncharacterized protein LOC129228664 [Uloborus diversus]|uniref:uncharacterized protein LOC129228664 n=1 Tax=Uloborus diversus TaxID=327109 RepID=UPI002409DD48|nr:uncharacterized protein LOC129228664 [Uloborus diversus]
MDHLYNAICKCPPTTAWNETTQRCDILNENILMMQNLPVIKKKYIQEDGSLDKVMLNVDIVNAMNTVYPKKILDYAYLLNYTESSHVVKCNVIAQFSGPTKYDAKRYTFYADLQLNCSDCSMYLLPPILLDKQSFKDSNTL